MTTLNNASFPKQDGSTDALARVIWQAFHDFFATTCGLALTSDTGQANLATITRSATTNEVRGYEIFKFGDALQTTAPVFFKVYYMMGSSATMATIGVQVGFSTDGLGNLSSVNKTRQPISALQKFTQGSTLDSTPRQAIGSGSTNRWCLGVGLDSSTPAENSGWMSLERSKDAAGADTADGVIFAQCAGASTIYFVYLPASGPWLVETALPAILANQTASVIGSVVGFGRPIPLAGSMKFPGKNLLCWLAADWTAMAESDMTIDGGTVHYMALTALFTGQVAVFGQTPIAGTRIALRYE